MTFEAIKSQLPTIPKTSGVYQFFDDKNKILYVGKAKNLVKRITNYTKQYQLGSRINRMILLAQRVEIVQTETEVEALLLEHNLIKKLSPRFNILLRDDKTFPHIAITNHQFPLVTKHRGNKGKDWRYFGPFASAFDVNHTINILRKIFLLRNCSDNEFKLRQKPCLEYQIKKCSAPCVGLISQEEYRIAINNAVAFLEGKSDELQKTLAVKMHNLSQAQNYENAALIRDQIKSLNAIQAKQNINIDQLGNTDIITIVTTNSNACVYIAFFRGGQNFGAKPYFYDLEDSFNAEKILENFLGQFYLSNSPPSLLLLNRDLSDKKLMEEFLSKVAERKVEIKIPKQGDKLRIINDQGAIALQNLEQKISNNFSIKQLHLELKKIFDLPKVPQKIEVYDNSHTSGTNAVGALITAGIEGFVKSGYRKFNIGKEGYNTGKKDDTAMLTEVLTRRFSKLEKENYPDLIIIDGGKPQITAVHQVFTHLKVKIPFISMAKGENRNAGEESFFRTTEEGTIYQVASDLAKHHPVMHYLQRIRDEAHRFAIMTHRKKRAKNLLPK